MQERGQVKTQTHVQKKAELRVSNFFLCDEKLFPNKKMKIIEMSSDAKIA